METSNPNGFNGGNGGGKENGGRKNGAGGPKNSPLRKRNNSQQSLETQSTANTGLMTPATQNLTLSDYVARRRRRAMNLAMAMGTISTTSWVGFLLLYLPPAAFVALTIYFLSTCFMIYLLCGWIGLGYTEIVQGGGFGRYLPTSIYEQLTSWTLHEWLQDTSFTLEYRHLMLYFIPGVTQQQLDEFVDRLPPRHRDNLRRVGLGHFFGEGAMRMIMGEQRYEAHLEQTDLRLPVLPEDDTFDEGEDAGDSIGLDIGDTSETAPNQMVITASRSLDFVPPPELATRSTPVSRAVVIPDANERDRENQIESNILDEALASFSASIANSGITSATGFAVQVVDMISPMIVGSGLGISSLSAGIGLYGIWAGSHRPNSAPRNMPSGRTLMYTGIFGGITAVSMLAVRSTVRYVAKASRPKDEKKSS